MLPSMMIWKWGTSDSSFKGKQRYSKSHWKDSCMLPTHWWAFLCTVEPRYNGNGYKGEPDITVKHSVPMDSCSSPFDFNSRADIKVKYFRFQSYPHWQSENALYYKWRVSHCYRVASCMDDNLRLQYSSWRRLSGISILSVTTGMPLSIYKREGMD